MENESMISITVEVDINDLLGELSALPHHKIFQLIVDLDNCVGDFNFTEKLRDHFNSIILEEETNVIIDELDLDYKDDE